MKKSLTVENLNECEKWLYNYLKYRGWAVCDYIRELAKENKFTKKQLKDARKSLGVKTVHQFDEDGATGNWFWYLE